jgi:superfamily II DNA or RNA helicase
MPIHIGKQPIAIASISGPSHLVIGQLELAPLSPFIILLGDTHRDNSGLCNNCTTNCFHVSDSRFIQQLLPLGNIQIFFEDTLDTSLSNPPNSPTTPLREFRKLSNTFSHPHVSWIIADARTTPNSFCLFLTRIYKFLLLLDKRNWSPNDIAQVSNRIKQLLPPFQNTLLQLSTDTNTITDIANIILSSTGNPLANNINHNLYIDYFNTFTSNYLIQIKQLFLSISTGDISNLSHLNPTNLLGLINNIHIELFWYSKLDRNCNLVICYFGYHHIQNISKYFSNKQQLHILYNSNDSSSSSSTIQRCLSIIPNIVLTPHTIQPLDINLQHPRSHDLLDPLLPTFKQEYFIQDTKKDKSISFLSPHQMILQQYISKQTLYDNLLVFHELGTGKTLSAIAIAEGFKEYVYNMGRRINIITKNSNIRENFKGQLELLYKHTHPDLSQNPLEFEKHIKQYYSFTTFGVLTGIVKNEASPQFNFSNSVVIIDEVHNVTNNDAFFAIHKILSRSINYRLVIMTATPVKDTVREFFEITSLLNIHTDTIIPIRDKTLDSKLVQLTNNPHIQIKTNIYKLTQLGIDLLEKSLVGKVSYVGSDSSLMPRRLDISSDIVPLYRDSELTQILFFSNMSPYQTSIYQKTITSDITSKIDDSQRNDNDNDNDNILSSNTLYKNSSDSATMVFPNGLYGKQGYNSVISNDVVLDKFKHVFNLHQDLAIYSCKFYSILSQLDKLFNHSTKRTLGKAFIFTQYVTEAGTSLLSHVLIENGYSNFFDNTSYSPRKFIVFDNRLTDKQRAIALAKFNNYNNRFGSDIQIIIGSPILSEGITLKAIQQTHLLEPSWNMTQINQVIGRSIRNMSHSHLPLELRQVSVYKHTALPSNDSISIDLQKYNLAEIKQRNNSELYRLLKRIAFDCTFHNSKQNTLADFSPECDYQLCNYTCKYNTPSDYRDYSTFLLNIDTVLQQDINYAKSHLVKLFTQSFIWTLDDILSAINYNALGLSIESIYYTLSQLVSKQTLFTGMFERDGYIIQYQQYYIFNRSGINIKTSFFTKMFDYSFITGNLPLSEYSLKHGIDLISTPSTPRTRDNVFSSHIPKSTKLKRTQNLDTNISNSTHSQFNTQLSTTPHIIYGNLDPSNNEFKIIDNRTITFSETDQRKSRIGRNCKTLLINQLIDIATHLNIDTNKLDSKKTLCNAIQNTLVSLDKVIKHD